MARILYPRAYNAASLKVIHEVPPHIPLPVTEYGGTERVVQGLLHGLSDLGVDLTVRCSGDSFPDPQDRKKFKVVANTKKAYGMEASFFAPKKTIEGSLMELFSQVAAMPASQRPLIHAHTEDTHLMVARCLNQSVITTVHNLPKPWVQENFSDMPMIAISKAQAASSALKGFDFVRTVYNGVDKTLYAPNFNVENDAPLVFLGRIGAKKAQISQSISPCAVTIALFWQAPKMPKSLNSLSRSWSRPWRNILTSFLTLAPFRIKKKRGSLEAQNANSCAMPRP